MRDVRLNKTGHCQTCRKNCQLQIKFVSNLIQGVFETEESYLDFLLQLESKYRFFKQFNPYSMTCFSKTTCTHCIQAKEVWENSV